MKLSDMKVKNLKPETSTYRRSDGGGLYIEVKPNGSKYWRLKYRYLGKEKKLAFGVYPDVSLSLARKRRDEARELLANGVDPSQAKRQEKLDALSNAANTFEAVGREWLEKQSEKWVPKTTQKIGRYLEKDIFPYIGNRPIAELKPPEILQMIRKIEDRQAFYLAGRVKQLCGQIFRYGVATGKNESDPTRDLTGALTPHKAGHFKAITSKELPDFLHDLERNDCRLYPQTRRGVYLLMLTLVRTSELILSTWDEIDFDNAVWEIPAERMKMDRPHIVPLSSQVLDLFEKQKQETNHINTPWVFPSQPRPKNPMSNNTILSAIKRLGYKGRMTGHGFRSLGMTTLMEELDYPFEIPDAQLSHSKGNNTRRAYDRTEYLPQRTKMLQEWADYIDGLSK